MKRLLSDYADDVLDAEEKRLVQEHLAVCEECSAELNALQAFIEDMGSVEKMRAPGDFLPNIHARIEQGSWPRRFFRRFFYPLHIKLPLEVAGIVAAALLVISIQQGMLPSHRKEYASPVMQAPPPAAQGQTGFASREELKHRPYDSFQTLAKKPPPEKTPIVIALLLKPSAEPDKETEARSSVGASSASGPAPKDEDQVRGRVGPSPRIAPAAPTGLSEAPKASSGSPATPQEKKTEAAHRKEAAIKPPESGSKTREEEKNLEKTERAQPESTTPRGEAAPTDLSGAISKVRNFISDAGGKVLSVEYAKEGNQPSSLTASIPAEKFASLLEKLSLMGELAQTTPPSSPPEGRESIQVKIELKTSR